MRSRLRSTKLRFLPLLLALFLFQGCATNHLIRWAEALAGIAQTGLAFTDVPFERERYE